MSSNHSENPSTGRFDNAASTNSGIPPSAFPGLHDLPKQLGAIREFAAYYVSAKVDALKVTARTIGILAALGVVGLFALITVVCTAVVLLLAGASAGIGWIFGHGYTYAWVGALVVGLVVLGALAAGIVFGMRFLTGTSRASLVKKYENRQREQRSNLGRDVRGREVDGAEHHHASA